MSQRAHRRETWVAVICVPALLAALYPLQERIDAHTQAVGQEKEELLLRSGKLVKKLSLGYEALLADIYWTRAVQYYGGKLRNHDPHFELLAPLLDLTTTLDPQLLGAYKFGMFFLAEPSPKGAGRPDLAVELVRRGIAANPDQWRLWGDLGFVYYWYLKDYKEAAAAYLEGSKHPGARDWMKAMAARVAGEGGSRHTSRFLWSEIYESAKDPQIRKNAFNHLQALKVEEDAEHLEESIVEFTRRFGRFPESLGELVRAGMLPGLPVDPAGYPYVLDRDSKVRPNPSSPIASSVPKPPSRK